MTDVPSPMAAMGAYFRQHTRLMDDASHPHLIAAGVRAHGIRVGTADPSWPIEGECLIIPIRNEMNTGQAMLAISAGGERHYWPGLSIAGGHHLVGEDSGAGPIVLAIDYATAAAIHEDTGWPVIMALEPDNLPVVAEWVGRRFAGRDIKVIVDHASRGFAEQAAKIAHAVLMPAPARVAGVPMAGIEERHADVEAAAIAAVLTSGIVTSRGCVLIADIMAALGANPSQRDVAAEMRVAAYLRARGWTRSQRRVDGRKGYWWVPPATKAVAEKVSEPVAPDVNGKE